ncbi:MAG: hypothetical protein OHK0029_20090 [Armatimonadaceae bacterium]
MIQSYPYTDFATACQAALAFLHQHFGFDLWMVTRTEGEDWIMLQTEDHGYNVQKGDVFNWSDSFCSRMVQGQGPCIAPDSSTVPAYAVAPIAQQVQIGAYIGLPLTRNDGSLFGTLCAIHPAPQPEAISAEQPLVELIARLLSSHLNAELKAAEETRNAERAYAEAMRDTLTGLYNRRGWDYFMTREEERCHQFGHPAALISIDLDGLKAVNDTCGHSAGDRFITRAALALQSVVRPTDILARPGGDEFAVLAVERDQPHAERLVWSLRQALMDAGIEASLGMAMRVPSLGLWQAWESANHRMYSEKQNRKQGRHILLAV